jgi:hypothetical protein
MIAKIVMSIPSLRKYLFLELGFNKYGREFADFIEYVECSDAFPDGTDVKGHYCKTYDVWTLTDGRELNRRADDELDRWIDWQQELGR